MSILNDPCLVLNRAWSPITTCTVQVAFGYLFNESGLFMSMEEMAFNVNGEDRYYAPYTLHGFDAWKDLPLINQPNGMLEKPAVISTGRFYMRVPEIVVLQSEIRKVHRKLACTKRNIARRDHHTCQYCGEKLFPSDETIDHVVPRMDKGPHSWTNCVLACKRCNLHKGHKSLKDTSLKLMVRSELKERYPHDPNQWNKPHEPPWSPIFRVPLARRKKSWSNFVKV